MKFDSFDRKILKLLQRDCSISNQELAERIGLSPTPCSRRVKRLEQSGIISSNVALLDREKLGLSLVVYLQISMDRHTPECVQRFQERVRTFSEVLKCYVMAGNSADYLVKVIVPDMNAYQHFLFDNITCIEGVTEVRSSFVLNTVVDKTELPLSYANGADDE